MLVVASAAIIIVANTTRSRQELVVRSTTELPETFAANTGLYDQIRDEGNTRICIKDARLKKEIAGILEKVATVKKAKGWIVCYHGKRWKLAEEDSGLKPLLDACIGEYLSAKEGGPKAEKRDELWQRVIRPEEAINDWEVTIFRAGEKAFILTGERSRVYPQFKPSIPTGISKDVLRAKAVQAERTEGKLQGTIRINDRTINVYEKGTVTLGNEVLKLFPEPKLFTER